MILEIDEEEREFLERICIRAELFSSMNLWKQSDMRSNNIEDLEKIRNLIVKLKSLTEKGNEK